MRVKKFQGMLLVGLLLVFVAVVWAQQPDDPAPAATAENSGTERVYVPAGTHLPLVLQNTINTRHAKRGDLVYFETIYPVTINNRVVIPAGSFVRGSLTDVKRPGRVKGRGQLFVRFDSLTLPNGYTVPLSASVRSAQGRGEESTNKEGRVEGEGSKGHDVGTLAGTATTGTLIGAAAGRGKGAAIGAGAGAAAGLAGVLLTRGKEVELPRGSTFDIVLNRELSLAANMVQFDSAGHPSNLPAPMPAERSSRGGIYRPWPY